MRADPGVGLVLETYERYWRKTPAIHRLILKSVLDPTTRLAVLKMGELGLAGLPPDEAAAVGIRTQVWSLERGAAGRRTVGG